MVPAGLLEALALVPDPRDPRGVRYPSVPVLAGAVRAVLTEKQHANVATILGTYAHFLAQSDRDAAAAVGAPYKVKSSADAASA